MYNATEFEDIDSPDNFDKIPRYPNGKVMLKKKCIGNSGNPCCSKYFDYLDDRQVYCESCLHFYNISSKHNNKASALMKQMNLNQ